MTKTKLVSVPSIAEVEEAIGQPFEQWAHQCHSISLAIVKSGIIPGGRVARGFCQGVISQHSWVATKGCYDRKALIIDPTLWSYDKSVEGIWAGKLTDRPHVPHGAGSIWEYGRPPEATEKVIKLTPTFELSETAQDFLSMIEPLDRRGWAILAHAPVEQWPAGEIIAAMADTKALSALVPIDVLGMVTDRNPNGLYMPGDEVQ
jgi:hypothetical protein